MRQILVIAITVGASMLASCSSGPLVANEPDRHLPDGFPNHSVEDIIDSLNVSREDILSYSTDGSISIESPDVSSSGGLSLRSRVGDSLSAVVRGPLGIVAGRALFTRDSLFFADRINGKDYAGPLEHRPPVPPPFSAILKASTSLDRLAMGLIDLNTEQSMWQISADSASYIMTRQIADELEETAVVDPTIWRITSYQQTVRKKTHITIQFEAFDSVDHTVVPRRAIIDYPDEETSVRLEHKRIRINPANLTIGGRPTAPTTNRPQ